MSERNKRFRNHCNISVALDRENNSVLVEVEYKEDVLLLSKRHSYRCADVVEELSRQGLAVGTPTDGGHMVLDNKTFGSKYPHISQSLCFPLTKAKIVEDEKPATSEEPSNDDKPKAIAKKRRSRPKTKTGDE